MTHITNGILYTLIFQKDLTDHDLIDRTARDEIERPGSFYTAEEMYAKIKEALASDATLTDSIPGHSHSEQEFRDFLVKMLRRMDEMRPWPVPPFRTLSAHDWTHLDSARPAARITLTPLAVRNRVHEIFRRIDDRRVMVFRLKSGTEVAIGAEWWPGSKDSALLLHDPGRPLADVLAEFCAATGITADEIAPVTEA